MLGLFKKEDREVYYLYMLPAGEENTCTYEIITEEELQTRYELGQLREGCRLFKIDREIKVSFEKVIHLE